MSNMDEFAVEIARIANKYEEDELSYYQAGILIETETEKLLMAYPMDVPDRILEAVFEAYADFMVQASEQQDVTQSEASNLIHKRAEELFDQSKPPEYIDALCHTYEAALFGDEDGANPEHDDKARDVQLKNRIERFFDDRDDPPGFFGGFSLN